MVDINLMGEDEQSEDRQREQSFAKTVNLDEPQPHKPEPEASPFTREAMGPAFPRETAPALGKRPPELYGDGSSRTKAYLIVLGLILAALTAVFFMIPRNGSKSRPAPKETPIVEAESPEENPAEIPGEGTGTGEAEPEPTPPPTNTAALASLSPLERDVVASTRLSTFTVKALANTFSSPNEFTLITYHGNHRFFVEFLSSSAESTTNLTSEIQRSISPLEIKVVSQSDESSNSGTQRKVLVSGSMDEQAAFAGFSGNITRMNSSEFMDWIKILGQNNGLTIKNSKTGQSEDSGDRVPMQIHFSGSGESIKSFLTALSDSNPTMAVSKIIVSPSDRKTFSSANLDLVMHFGFVETQ